MIDIPSQPVNFAKVRDSKIKYSKYETNPKAAENLVVLAFGHHFGLLIVITKLSTSVISVWIGLYDT